MYRYPPKNMTGYCLEYVTWRVRDKTSRWNHVSGEEYLGQYMVGLRVTHRESLQAWKMTY